MESGRRPIRRAVIHNQLIEQRARVHRIRLLCVPAMRSDDSWWLNNINDLLHEEIGLQREFCQNLRHGLQLLRTMTPGWTISSIDKHGSYYRVTLVDTTGRNRPPITNKFIHPRLDYIMVYVVLTAHLIDINTRLEEFGVDN